MHQIHKRGLLRPGSRSPLPPARCDVGHGSMRAIGRPACTGSLLRSNSGQPAAAAASAGAPLGGGRCSFVGTRGQRRPQPPPTPPPGLLPGSFPKLQPPGQVLAATLCSSPPVTATLGSRGCREMLAARAKQQPCQAVRPAAAASPPPQSRRPRHRPPPAAAPAHGLTAPGSLPPPRVASDAYPPPRDRRRRPSASRAPSLRSPRRARPSAFPQLRARRRRLSPSLVWLPTPDPPGQ